MKALPNLPEFSFRTRAAGLEKLRAGAPVFDALIVGGGIVGTGLARELAIRGISTLLVEKDDFAQGTSSRSSKLIHGGLRYLEMFDFGLVFEALAERHWLLKSHPHLVKPLEFNLPLYSKDKAPPGTRSSTLLRMGLWLYDALSLFRSPFFHGTHSPEQMHRFFPGLKKEGLRGGLYYADAMMLDDELVHEAAYDAFRRDAQVYSYLEVEKVEPRASDGLFTVWVRDRAKGATTERFSVKAKEVISCVGPWTEIFGEKIGSSSEKKLKPSKGVHLIVPWKRFPIESCLVMNAPDGRIIFAIPRKDMGFGAEVVIIGTTDSNARDERIEEVVCKKSDVDYLLEILARYFPENPLRPSDVCMTYAGIRPLIDSGAESEAKTSREHEIWRNKDGVVFMAGGKYTTFRKISQEIADFAFPHTGGGKTNRESKSLLSDPREYWALETGDKLWGRFTREWLEYKLKFHAPMTLEDVVFRRIPVWMAGNQLDPATFDLIASVCSRHFGWSESEVARQKKDVQAKLSAWRRAVER